MVMATAIMAVGLDLMGFAWPARVLLALTVALWMVMAVSFALRLRGGREGRHAEESKPITLTVVAGTGVLGVGLLLFLDAIVGEVLLGLMAVVWAVLLPQVVKHLPRRLPGTAFLVTVSTQSLVVLSATLAKQDRQAHWLVWPAYVLLALALALYVHVLGRFDFGQLAEGAGDHWVLSGSLSISALACARLAMVAGSQARRPLEWLMLAILAVALAWYLLLAYWEIRRPRLRYDGRRWSTVFPFGMTAVVAMMAGTVAGLPWLNTLGQVLLWPALAVWAVVAMGAVRHTAASRRPAP
jgi:tellurite resistance protein TehA-like permease